MSDRIHSGDGILMECSILRFGELKSLTKRLAYGLLNRTSLKQDDVLLVFSPATFMYPAFVQATQAATLCISVGPLYYSLNHTVDDCISSRRPLIPWINLYTKSTTLARLCSLSERI